MKGIFYWLLLGWTLVSLHSSAQDFSNKGREFWLAYSYHVGMVNGGGQPAMTLYITSDVNTTYNVEIYGVTNLRAGNITAGQVVTVNIPNTYFINDEGLFTNRAIRVSAEKPVVVYSFITRSAASAATLCLPTTVLGREYYSVNFTQVSNEPRSHSYITIVGVEDNTTVEITPTANTQNGWIAGNTYTVSLNKGTIYQVLGRVVNNTGEDLTGTRVQSVAGAAGGCKRIAVFSGSGKMFIGCTSQPGETPGADNLYQQLYPAVTWGKKYLTAPGVGRENNYYRIIKSNPATNVYLNGTLIPATSFVNNIYYEFLNDRPNLIEADQPVTVAQYFTSQGCMGNVGSNDPDMILLNPVEQNIDKVTLVTTSLVNAPAQHNVHVIMRNTGSGLTSFRLDGSPVPATSWQVHPADPTYSYAYLSNLSQGYHRLESDSGFNAVVYGYANVETYGYSAGANVKDLYQFISIQNQFATVNHPSTCRNTPFFFSMTFPYQPTEIRWLFGPALNAMGINDVTIPAPAYDSSWIVNGKQLYRYKLPGPYYIRSTGTYPIKVFAQNPTPDGCNGEQEINYDVEVSERPTAGFSVVSSGCLSDSVRFTGSTTASGQTVLRWVWNFDDGQSSPLPNPAHLFQAAGTYNVQFSAISDIGCVSDTVPKAVIITDPPVAKFGITAPYCIGRAIVMTDSSTSVNSPIVKWTWDFGDGTAPVVSTTNAPQSHIYGSAGSYTITLQVESQVGCKSTIASETIRVSHIPVPGFILPGNCVDDPVSQFMDTSTIADGTVPQFTYLWDFGDPAATTANPNHSSQKDGTHKYTATGDYQVKLVVTSGSGCADSLTKMFTVNGAVPVPSIIVNRGLEHCSNDTIFITDNSSVTPGRLVKLEIYWDYAGDPSSKVVVDNPVPGTTYQHKYPEFFAPATHIYQVKLVAYSGINCLEEENVNLTLKARPQVVFNPIPPICGNVPAFRVLADVTNTTGGEGVFSGAGIDSSGLFDPSAVTAGTIPVRYTYTGTNGCSSFSEQAVIVHPVPTINAGEDRFVLEGGAVVLNTIATGNGLTYAWSPATYLNNPAAAQPLTTPKTDINYTVIVTSAEGCKASDQVLVSLLKTPLIPNVFSPNGDGINDRWEIKYLDSYPGTTVEIFNRYGQKVFISKGYNTPWDGSYKGSQVPAGTYYYVIDPKNGRKPMSGYVDIIR